MRDIKLSFNTIGYNRSLKYADNNKRTGNQYEHQGNPSTPINKILQLDFEEFKMKPKGIKEIFSQSSRI